jgi:hypothetical protein
LIIIFTGWRVRRLRRLGDLMRLKKRVVMHQDKTFFQPIMISSAK